MHRPPPPHVPEANSVEAFNDVEEDGDQPLSIRAAALGHALCAQELPPNSFLTGSALGGPIVASAHSTCPAFHQREPRLLPEPYDGRKHEDGPIPAAGFRYQRASQEVHLGGPGEASFDAHEEVGQNVSGAGFYVGED